MENEPALQKSMSKNETIKVDEMITKWSTFFGYRPRVFELSVCPLRLNGEKIISLIEAKGGVTAYMVCGPVHLRITRKEIEDLIPEEERFQKSIW